MEDRTPASRNQPGTDGKARCRFEKAFRDNEFILFQQRIRPVCARDEACFVEVLVRHRDEENNLTPPGGFLPVLEHFGMLGHLDRWVVERVLAWHRAGARGRAFRYSINVFTETLTGGTLVPHVAALLGSRREEAPLLCFEVMERGLDEQGDVVKSRVRELRAMGCLVAVGGIGRAALSFRPIHQMGADFVKIDGSLARSVLADAGARAKIAALQRVCRSAGMRTIAEMVEDARVLDVLGDLGVDYAQGFGISKPAPIDELLT